MPCNTFGATATQVADPREVRYAEPPVAGENLELVLGVQKIVRKWSGARMSVIRAWG